MQKSSVLPRTIWLLAFCFLCLLLSTFHLQMKENFQGSHEFLASLWNTDATSTSFSKFELFPESDGDSDGSVNYATTGSKITSHSTLSPEKSAVSNLFTAARDLNLSLSNFSSASKNLIHRNVAVSNESCQITVVSHIAGVECRVTKAMDFLLTNKTADKCLYNYIYMTVTVNERYTSNFLATPYYPSMLHDFGAIVLPKSLRIRRIKIKVSSYFNTKFDALGYLSNISERDVTLQETLLFETGWPAPVGMADRSVDDGAACPLHRVLERQRPQGRLPICNFSGNVPGYWDTKKHQFLPAECAYPSDSWSKDQNASLDGWVQMVGDSNMRRFFLACCEALGARVHILPDLPTTKTKYQEPRVCFSRGGRRALVFTVSWMNRGSGIFIDAQQLLGRPLLPAICGQRGKPGPLRDACATRWNTTAILTLFLAGSHYPELEVPRASEEGGAWLREMVGSVAGGTRTSALVLTCPVCVARRYKTQAPTRNNHRISAVNAALTAHAAAAGLAVLDFFSISMAAGCGHSSDGLHYSKAVYRAQADALFSLLARARR